jgi:hypothetical protein
MRYASQARCSCGNDERSNRQLTRGPLVGQPSESWPRKRFSCSPRCCAENENKIPLSRPCILF